MSRFFDYIIDRYLVPLAEKKWYISGALAICAYAVVRWSYLFVYDGAFFYSLVRGSSAFSLVYASPFIIAMFLSLFNEKSFWQLRLESLDSVAKLKGMGHREFESAVAGIYRAKGYWAELTEDGPDGGIDVILRKDRDVKLVQCKHWIREKVGVELIRELYGVLHAHPEATRAIFVTMDGYTKPAKEFAAQHPDELELLDENNLVQLLNEARPEDAILPMIPDDERIPECPKCKISMVWHPANERRRGFYGCPNFHPKNCREKFDPKTGLAA